MTRKPVTFCLVLLFVLATVFSACSTTKSSGEVVEEQVIMDSYAGVIPAADGPGINVLIILNSDNTFELTYDYIDRDDVVSISGDFTWDETGTIVDLGTSDYPPFYRVAEDHLLQLDLEGNEITGDLAEMYILMKL